ncbi:DNA cytosine methyltransferase [Rhizobium phaseoli]|uniref:DNA cytosine methyltransferase n=1 Tax=Rhizobium phaseoli TaxID=396 RepID=UPI000A5247CF|nr:DNA cytosine methyltransferase [Rhizobium phaseoli]
MSLIRSKDTGPEMIVRRLVHAMGYRYRLHRRDLPGRPDLLFQTILGNPERGPLVKAIAHCIYAESARHTGTDWSRNYVWYPEGRVRRFLPVETELAQGFPADWTRPRHFDERQADKIDSLRYHAVGNSVTPPVAEWVGHRLMEAMNAQEVQSIKGLAAAE